MVQTCDGWSGAWAAAAARLTPARQADINRQSTFVVVMEDKVGSRSRDARLDLQLGPL